MDQGQSQAPRKAAEEGDHSEEEDQMVDEDQLYDLEDKKVLNKRRKRVLKVEDCNQALE